jgi:hypothetical protein
MAPPALRCSRDCAPWSGRQQLLHGDRWQLPLCSTQFRVKKVFALTYRYYWCYLLENIFALTYFTLYSSLVLRHDFSKDLFIICSVNIQCFEPASDCLSALIQLRVSIQHYILINRFCCNSVNCNSHILLHLNSLSSLLYTDGRFSCSMLWTATLTTCRYGTLIETFQCARYMVARYKQRYTVSVTNICDLFSLAAMRIQLWNTARVETYTRSFFLICYLTMLSVAEIL